MNEQENEQENQENQPTGNGTEENKHSNLSQEELVQKIEEITKERDNVVGELKADREKRQKQQEEIDELKQALQSSVEQNQKDPEEEKISRVVTQVLTEREKQTAEKNKKLAWEQFIANHKTFDESNDPGGVKRQALQEKVQRFNTEGLYEVEDFMSVFNDASSLLGYGNMQQNQNNLEEQYASTPSVSPQPQGQKQSNLDDKEKQLIAQNGWTEERLTKLKESMPDYVQKLKDKI